jgi:hypothetical protein
MEVNTMGTGKTIKWKDLGNLVGIMGGIMKESGKTI